MSGPPSPSSLPSLCHSSPSSSSSSLLEDVPLPSDRPNQHLAVLLPKYLWKPDSFSSTCDNLYCRVPFSLFERRHHCRKCGGIFCATCSSRSTPLLDTSNLLFLHPPRNIPLTQFESPISPIINSRVCGDCWNQLHGCSSTPSSSIPIRPPHSKRVTYPIIPKLQHRSTTLSTGLQPTADTILPPSLKRRSTLPASLTSSSNHNFQSSTTTTTSQPTNHPPEIERSYGELDTYPLSRSSVLCKATGGGRWEPKQIPVLVGYRLPIPGGKAPYEIEMEREELLDRQRRENPVVKDGDFQYRFFANRVPEQPLSMARSPRYHFLSTF